jgi:hypothetical protein
MRQYNSVSVFRTAVESKRRQEAGARRQEPGARSQEPGGRSQEPGARSCRSQDVQESGCAGVQEFRSYRIRGVRFARTKLTTAAMIAAITDVAY